MTAVIIPHTIPNVNSTQYSKSRHFWLTTTWTDTHATYIYAHAPLKTKTHTTYICTRATYTYIHATYSNEHTPLTHTHAALNHTHTLHKHTHTLNTHAHTHTTYTHVRATHTHDHTPLTHIRTRHLILSRYLWDRHATLCHARETRLYLGLVRIDTHSLTSSSFAFRLASWGNAWRSWFSWMPLVHFLSYPLTEALINLTFQTANSPHFVPLTHVLTHLFTSFSHLLMNYLTNSPHFPHSLMN